MIKNWVLLFLLVFINIAGCSRSPAPEYYVLNPLILQKDNSNRYQHISLGIEEISLPAYIDRPQVVIQQDSNRVAIEEYHQWAEKLSKNINRVISTDLSALLPGAIIERAPWSLKFKPNYRLRIKINQFTIDRLGSCILSADYVLYYQDELVKQGNRYYHSTISEVSTENLVISMNRHLTSFSQDLAKIMRIK